MQKTPFNFFCLSTKKLRRGTLRCCRKVRVSKNFMHKKGISLFPFEDFLSHSAEKIRRGTLLCFRKFLVWKKIGNKRGWGYHDFRTKFFCLTVPKDFLGVPLFQKCSGIEKFLDNRGITILSKFFLSHSAKKFRGEPFNASENLGYRKILCIIGEGITIFRRKLFVSQCRKNS